MLIFAFIILSVIIFNHLLKIEAADSLVTM